MNCQQYQEKIVESLATGAACLAPEVSAHQNSCPVCAAFFDSQRDLFQSIDAGLHTFVNQAVPPLLLSSVRARLEEHPVPSGAWIPQWSFAVLAAVAVLAITVVYTSRRQAIHLSSAKVIAIAPRIANKPEPAMQRPQDSPSVSPRPGTKLAPPAVSPEAAPEVLVLAEEREAFARFIAETPERKDAALELPRPESRGADDSIDISLLQIDDVEVTPLEGSPGK
jgi:hypothetical protein